MSMKVELIPLVGAILDGRTVRLGDTKAEVERTLGRPLGAKESAARPYEDGPHGSQSIAPDGAPEEAEPLPAGPHWFYFNNELHLGFDEAGRVEFIELLGGPSGALQPTIDGLEIFQAKPEAVYDLLKAKNNGPIVISISCYSCVFLNLETGVYRGSVPEDVTEMIGEAQAGGRPLSSDEIDHETRLTHWTAVGLGVKGYYAI